MISSLSSTLFEPIKKAAFQRLFLYKENYFFASAAGAAGAAGAASLAASAAGAAGAAAGASAGFASSFLPQAAKAIANIAANTSDFFICNFL
jgi:hypothetical protein